MHWDSGKENGNYREYRGYIGVILGLYCGCIGIMEKNMETTISGSYAIHWVYIGIMEKKVETSVDTRNPA